MKDMKMSMTLTDKNGVVRTFEGTAAHVEVQGPKPFAIHLRGFKGTMTLEYPRCACDRVATFVVGKNLEPDIFCCDAHIVKTSKKHPHASIKPIGVCL